MLEFHPMTFFRLRVNPNRCRVESDDDLGKPMTAHYRIAS